MQPDAKRVPCPSWGAYKRHLRRGEECRACLDFVAGRQQAYRDRCRAEGRHAA